MAIGLIMDFPASDRDARSLYDRMIRFMDAQPSPPPGLLLHWAALTQSGVRVVEVWSVRSDIDRYIETDLVNAIEEYGVPEPDMEFYDIHNIIAGTPAVLETVS